MKLIRYHLPTLVKHVLAPKNDMYSDIFFLLNNLLAFACHNAMLALFSFLVQSIILMLLGLMMSQIVSSPGI